MILVEGGDSDGTVEVAWVCRPDVRVVTQNRRGKDTALACGFATVRGDIVDADGSSDPEEIPRYVEELLADADFAEGTRFAAGGGSSDLTRLRNFGHHGLNLVVNVLYRTRYTDLCCSYDALWTLCLPTLGLQSGDEVLDRKLWGDGFEMATIINTRIAREKLRVVEVPSTWRDGFRVLRAAVSESFRRTPVSHHTAHLLSTVAVDEVDVQAVASA